MPGIGREGWGPSSRFQKEYTLQCLGVGLPCPVEPAFAGSSRVSEGNSGQTPSLQENTRLQLGSKQSLYQ